MRFHKLLQLYQSISDKNCFPCNLYFHLYYATLERTKVHSLNENFTISVIYLAMRAGALVPNYFSSLVCNRNQITQLCPSSNSAQFLLFMC